MNMEFQILDWIQSIRTPLGDVQKPENQYGDLCFKLGRFHADLFAAGTGYTDVD